MSIRWLNNKRTYLWIGIAVLAMLGGVWYTSTTSSEIPLTPAKNIDEGRERIIALVRKFDQGWDIYRKQNYNESQVRKDFIDPMLAALGWDSTNINKANLFKQDTVPEMRLPMSNRMKFLDYGQRIDGRHAFSFEAKAVHVDVDKPAYQWEAQRYAWSSMHSELSALSNFLQFRVYDSRLKPDWDNPDRGEIKKFSMSYMEYPLKWDLLWNTFSKEAVSRGSIKMLLNKLDKSLARIPPDKALIAEIDQMRLVLARDIFANNKNIDADVLNEATHHILNRIIFTRILEDRDIETTGVLRMRVLHWQGDPVIWADKKKKRQDSRPLQDVLQDEFTRLNKRYHGVIFSGHPSDKLKISDTVLEKIIMSLYPEGGCPYDFSAIDASVLGKVYENYLGKRIVINKDDISLEEKPEVREAGGIFYTRPVIAQYIVRKVLVDKVKGKTPKEICNIKLIDPACGCGAFLMEATRFIFDYCRDYYRKHPDAITNKDTDFPDAEALFDGNIKLSPLLKAELVKNIIHGVDIDPQAVEISTMWLYLMILEREASPVVNMERQYKIPNRRTWDNTRKKQSFKLPDLKSNIVCGNALVEPDFIDTETDKAVIEKSLPFDWKNNGTNIEKVMNTGGFDAVVGNPPYLSYRGMKKLLPDQLKYICKKYRSMNSRQPDLAYAFTERGPTLLKEHGTLGYILTNRILYNEAAEAIRKLITEQNLVSELVDFGVVQLFGDAQVYLSIVILSKTENRQFRYAKVTGDSLPDNGLSFISKRKYQSDNAFTAKYPSSMLSEKTWAFPNPDFLAIHNTIVKTAMRLHDYADVISGIETGLDKVLLVEVQSEDDGLCTIINRFGEKHVVEKDSLKPIIRAKDVLRYSQAKHTYRIIWLYDDNGKLISEEQCIGKYPRAYGYMLKHKALLEKRTRTSPWYGMRRQSEWTLQQKPKLFVAVAKDLPKVGIDITGKNLAASISEGCIVVPKDGEPSIFALLGILNSRLLLQYNSIGRGKLSGGYSTFSVSLLENTPIPEFTSETSSKYNKIGDAVKQIIEGKSKGHDTSEIENNVENLVRELYGIPAESTTPISQIDDGNLSCLSSLMAS